jgi:hypothetical protein
MAALVLYILQPNIKFRNITMFWNDSFLLIASKFPFMKHAQNVKKKLRKTKGIMTSYRIKKTKLLTRQKQK